MILHQQPDTPLTCHLTPDGADAIAIISALQLEGMPVLFRHMPYLASLFKPVCRPGLVNEEKLAKGRMQDVRSHATRVPVTCQIWLTIQNSIINYTLLHSYERLL